MEELQGWEMRRYVYIGCDCYLDYIFVWLARMTDPYRSLTEMDPALSIHNICGKFYMNATLDLHFLAGKIWNSSYNPRRLPALILRKTKPRATVLIFATGRAMVIGAETMERLQEVAMKVAREIGALMNIKKLRAQEVMVTNIVGMGQLNFRIDLNRLCENRRAIKLDNMSPVIYRLEQPLKKVMVYRTGKLMFWGAKSIDDMEMAFTIMRKEMQAYQLVSKPERYDPNEQETYAGGMQWGL